MHQKSHTTRLYVHIGSNDYNLKISPKVNLK
jgi:hypothetical protein